MFSYVMECSSFVVEFSHKLYIISFETREISRDTYVYNEKYFVPGVLAFDFAGFVNVI